MRNAAFLGVIVLLVSYIYFFEEKKTIQDSMDKAKAERLLDIKDAGELNYLKGKNFELIREGDSFKIKKELLTSNKQLDTFFSQLQNFKVLRILDDNELKEIDVKSLAEDDITIEAGFKNNRIKITLGKKIQFNQNFYLKISNQKNETVKWVVAKFQGEYSANAQDKNAHRSEVSYKQAKTLFLLKADFFKELNPLFNIKNVEKLKISSFRNRPYEILVGENKTIPSPPNGVEEIDQRFSEFFKGLPKLRAKQSDLKSKYNLSGEIGTLNFGKIILKVYSKMNGKQGYYLVNGNIVFTIDSSTYRYLFTPQQFFWDKKPKLAASDYSIYDKNGKIVLKSNLKAKNIWTQVLAGEAYSVRENYKKEFPFEYKVVVGSQSYLVGQAPSGLELYDVERDLIFHYLEKIK